MKCFYLYRKKDLSGVSGTGIVAEGCEFSTGKVVLSWVTDKRSVAVYDSMQEMIDIHGHGNRTMVQEIGQFFNPRVDSEKSRKH